MNAQDFFRDRFLSFPSPFGRPYLDDLVQQARSYMQPRTEDIVRSAETLLEWLLDGAVDSDTGESFLSGDQRDRVLAEFTQARRIERLRTCIDLSGIKFIPGLSWKELLGIFAQERLFQLYCLEGMGSLPEYEAQDDPTVHYVDESVFIREATEAVMFGELEERVAARAKTILTEQLARAGTESHRRTKPLRELVIARYMEKYTASSNRSAARKIFDTLVEENIIEWRDQYKVYFLEHSSETAVLRNEEPWNTFAQWIRDHKARNALSP